MDKNKTISKSKYVAGLQCIKYLWYLINEPEVIPPFDEAMQFRFQQGHEVGNLAKSLFPDGVEIEHGVDIEAELARARELAGLSTGADLDTDDDANFAEKNVRCTLFEPAFTYKNAFARADILEPAGASASVDAWNIIEVKSASSIKEINKYDISFQKYCYEGAGLKINKCYLMYLNKDFKKDGPIDPRRFFLMYDVTAEAQILKKDVEKNLETMLEVINSATCPEVSIGKNCSSPYNCPLKQVCWGSMPKNNVFELYKGKDLACYFYQNGIIEISEINEVSMLNTVQLMQYRAVKESCEIVDREGIWDFLKKLKYPLRFLDFETFATAIPLFDGLRPYQNIPFQFSCHLMRSSGFMQSADARPENHYFLAGNDKTDPRKGFLESLKKALGYDGISNDRYSKTHNNGIEGRNEEKYDNKYGNLRDTASPAASTTTSSADMSSPAGSILVYYEAFEKNILRELAAVYPEHAWWVEDAIGRIVDLYEPFGKFYYYSSRQKGSASLKNVLPALTGISYNDMEISNGQMASIKYINITFLKDEQEPDKAQIEKIRKDLLDYCGLDTEGMIFILRELYKIVR